MRNPESHLVAKILLALEQQIGGYWVKIHGGPFQRAGLPDIIGCKSRLFFGLEVKMPGGDLEPLQRIELDLIRREGQGVAACVHSVDEALAVVRQALRQAKESR